MAKLADILDTAQLAADIADGYVNVQTNGPLSILNYTPKTQFEGYWTPVRRACRGLIYQTDTQEIVARPFEKFMNYGQVALPREVATKRPIVSEKADGSLGIVYWFDDRWKVATRGSFTSDQAVHATERLKDYIDVYDPNALLHDRTYLVEIIYPQNRIVVDYAGADELRLLAVIDIETGADMADVTWAGPAVEKHMDITDAQSAYMVATSGLFDGAEGLVLCYPRYKAPSFRIKCKSLEYLRLHRLLTGLSTKKIYEHLAAGKTVEDFIADVPDEFMRWVSEQAAALKHEFAAVNEKALFDFQQIAHYRNTQNRKDFATATKKSTYPDILFRMFDYRDYDDLIWKRIKPDFRLYAEDNDG